MSRQNLPLESLFINLILHHKKKAIEYAPLFRVFLQKEKKKKKNRDR